MGETARKHADLFTSEEAVEYLHLDNVATLDTLKGQGFLVSYRAGKRVLYWRADLDDCAKKIVGEQVQPRVKHKPMRLAGGE